MDSNVVINAYGFTMFEALIEDHLFGYLRETVAATANTIGGVLPTRGGAADVVGSAMPTQESGLVVLGARASLPAPARRADSGRRGFAAEQAGMPALPGLPAKGGDGSKGRGVINSRVVE